MTPEEEIRLLQQERNDLTYTLHRVRSIADQVLYDTEKIRDVLENHQVRRDDDTCRVYLPSVRPLLAPIAPEPLYPAERVQGARSAALETLDKTIRALTLIVNLPR